VEGPKEIVPAYFYVEKNVTRKPVEVISDEEGRTD